MAILSLAGAIVGIKKGEGSVGAGFGLVSALFSL
jgi:hypothetical protein